MKRIVIKIGTNLLTDHHQRLDLNNMRHIVYQIVEKINENIQFIIISSGAITSGAKHINIATDNLAEKQAAASIGQILLFQKYYEFFQTKNICVGQLLLTKDNFDDKSKKMNINQTIETLLKHNVIPIINENDSVSTEEIQFGDNDQLSAIFFQTSQHDFNKGIYMRHQSTNPFKDGSRKTMVNVLNSIGFGPRQVKVSNTHYSQTHARRLLKSMFEGLSLTLDSKYVQF